MAIADSGCTCKYIEARKPMDTTGCPVHTQKHYKCKATNCKDYRPVREPVLTWPRCVCGEIAQEHN